MRSNASDAVTPDSVDKLLLVSSVYAAPETASAALPCTRMLVDCFVPALADQPLGSSNPSTSAPVSAPRTTVTGSGVLSASPAQPTKPNDNRAPIKVFD